MSPLLHLPRNRSPRVVGVRIRIVLFDDTILTIGINGTLSLEA